MTKLKLSKDSHTVHLFLIILLGILIVGSISGTYYILNLLSSRSTTLVSLRAKSQALNQEQTNLAIDKTDIKKYGSLDQISQSIVPQNKDQAQAVREIVSIADSNNITLNTISFPVSNLGTTAGASTPASAQSITLSQLTPVKGIPGVYTLPIQISVSQPSDAISYSSFYNFLSQLQQNRLTSQVTDLSITPILTNNLITFSLTINEYIKPR